jgi:hypothetical protein
MDALDDDDGAGIQPMELGGGDAELGGSGGAGGAALAELVASGRLVTSDRLVGHSLATGRMLRRIYGWVAPQAAFQPGATRFRGGARDAAGDAHRGQRRFLAWNQHGAVVSRSEGEAGNEVDVLVADKSRGGRDAGMVKRKAKASISNESIEEAFVRKTPEEFDVVAVYIENPENAEGARLVGAARPDGALGGGDEARGDDVVEVDDVLAVVAEGGEDGLRARDGGL